MADTLDLGQEIIFVSSSKSVSRQIGKAEKEGKPKESV